VQFRVKCELLELIYKLAAKGMIRHVALNQHILQPLQNLEEGLFLVISAHIVIIDDWLYLILL
jgi:hypothetical protein